MNTGTCTAAQPQPVAHSTSYGQQAASTVHPGSIEANQLPVTLQETPYCAPGPSTSHIHIQTDEGDSSSSALSRSPSPLSESSNSTENSSESQLSANHSESDSDSSSSLESDGLSTQCVTYKLVGDNIDKNVRPREMRSDCQTRSLHYFHTYAVRDRVDMSQFSNDVHIPDVSSIDLKQLLPTPTDEDKLRDNFAILVGRTLAKYMPFFSKFCADLEKHIPHEFSSEMSQKSEVVSSPLYKHAIYAHMHTHMHTDIYLVYNYGYKYLPYMYIYTDTLGSTRYFPERGTKV